MDFARILKGVETLAHIGRAASRFKAGLDAAGTGEDGAADFGGGAAGFTEEEPRSNDLAAGTRMFGQLEARLAGVLVSALKEAFDRDRAHLDMEREQIEHERKRAEELMRLELLRQAGERELQSIRGSIVVTLVVWITSVLFMMLHHSPFGIAGLVLLGAGWLFLLGALGWSFAAYRQVSAALVRASRDPAQASAFEQQAVTPMVSVLIVGGLACTAASLLVALAT
jgi:hypothetical protein